MGGGGAHARVAGDWLPPPRRPAQRLLHHRPGGDGRPPPPAWCRTQLFRRRQDWAGLCRLLANPRAHTGAGYHYRAHGAARPGPSCATAATGAWAAAADATPQPLMDALCPSKTAVLVLAPTGGYFVPEKKKDGGGCGGRTSPAACAIKLWGRQPALPAVDYVALGGGGPAHLLHSVYRRQRRGGGGARRAPPRPPRRGPSSSSSWPLRPTGADTYCLRLATMTGRGLLLRLANLLTGRARHSLAGVVAIATTPAGEWPVRFLDGACRCGNLPAAASRRLQALQSQRKTIGRMSFAGRRRLGHPLFHSRRRSFLPSPHPHAGGSFVLSRGPLQGGWSLAWGRPFRAVARRPPSVLSACLRRLPVAGVRRPGHGVWGVVGNPRGHRLRASPPPPPLSAPSSFLCCKKCAPVMDRGPARQAGPTWVGVGNTGGGGQGEGLGQGAGVRTIDGGTGAVDRRRPARA